MRAAYFTEPGPAATGLPLPLIPGGETIRMEVTAMLGEDDGRGRSLARKKPGFNYLPLPKDRPDSQIVPELEPRGDEITVLKTTDSALTGTNLRILLSNMGIRDVVVAGIFTDQCVSSSVRSLVDESFGVVEDCCAAATMELHRHELEIIDMIYCRVVQLDEALSFFTA